VAAGEDVTDDEDAAAAADAVEAEDEEEEEEEEKKPAADEWGGPGMVLLPLYQPSSLSNQEVRYDWLVQAQCSFSKQFCTRGCHWFARLLTRSSCMHATNHLERPLPLIRTGTVLFPPYQPIPFISSVHHLLLFAPAQCSSLPISQYHSSRASTASYCLHLRCHHTEGNVIVRLGRDLFKAGCTVLVLHQIVSLEDAIA
jgi:hypothetical protein